MSALETILPTNASPFERTLEQVTAFPNLPIDGPAHLSDPWTVDARYLPWLAHRFQIEIWNDDWREEKKRSVIARAIELQRIKGTEKGLRDYVDLADAEVKQVVTPPKYFWAGSALTKNEIDAWHRTMPQIRVYFVKEKRPASSFSFAGQHLGAMFAMADIGRALYGRKARLWDSGTETPRQIIDLKDTTVTGKAVMAERISIAGKCGATFFAGGFAEKYIQAVIIDPEIITWNRDITYSHASMEISTTTVTPGLSPIDIRAERKSDKWKDVATFAAGRFSNAFFVGADVAGENMYDRIVLHDKKRAAPVMKGLSFADHSLLGMAPYSANTIIDLKEQRKIRAFYADDGIAGRHIAWPDDPTRRTAVSRAATLSKAVRDRIYVSFQTTRPLTFGDAAPIDGTTKFNARVKNRL